MLISFEIPPGTALPVAAAPSAAAALRGALAGVGVFWHQNRYLRPYCSPRPRQHDFRTVRSRCRADSGGRIGSKCRQDSRLLPFIGSQLAALRRAQCAEAVEPPNALSSSGPPILKTFTIHHCTAWTILDNSACNEYVNVLRTDLPHLVVRWSTDFCCFLRCHQSPCIHADRAVASHCFIIDY